MTLRFEPLLICSVAACYVGHDITIRDALCDVLTTVSPLVFLPFFTLTGASLQLLSMVSVWSQAVSIFLLRGFALLAGSFLGSRWCVTLLNCPMRWCEQKYKNLCSRYSSQLNSDLKFDEFGFHWHLFKTYSTMHVGLSFYYYYDRISRWHH